MRFARLVEKADAAEARLKLALARRFTPRWATHVHEDEELQRVYVAMLVARALAWSFALTPLVVWRFWGPLPRDDLHAYAYMAVLALTFHELARHRLRRAIRESSDQERLAHEA